MIGALQNVYLPKAKFHLSRAVGQWLTSSPGLGNGTLIQIYFISFKHRKKDWAWQNCDISPLQNVSSSNAVLQIDLISF